MHWSFDKTLRVIGGVFAGVGVAMLLVMTYFLTTPPSETRFAGVLATAIISGVFSLIGWSFLLSVRHRARVREELLRNGERVRARIRGVERNTSISVNGRYPWRVVCEFEENGTLYVCRSDNLAEEPTLTTDVVDVCRDPSNPRKYTVDLTDAVRPTVTL